MKIRQMIADGGLNLEQIQTLIPSALFPLAGGGFLGFIIDYALKKIVKLALIVLGLITLLLGYLEYQKWISVNWIIVENQTSTLMTHVAHKIYAVTQHMNHEIPVVGLGALGFLPGLVVGF